MTPRVCLVLLSLVGSGPARAQDSRPFAGKDVDSVLRALIGTDATQRARAEAELVTRGAAVVPLLIGALDGSRKDVPASIAESLLARIGQPAVIPLLRVIQQGLDPARDRAVRTVGVIEPPPGQAIPLIARIIETESDGGRAQSEESALLAARTLARFKEASVPALVELIRHADPHVRLNAVSVLGRYAAAAVPALKDALHDQDEDVRAAVLLAFGRIGPPARIAVPDLVETLNGGDDRLRTFAVRALASIGKPAVEALVQQLESGESEQRARAAAALGTFRTQRELVVVALERTLQGPDAAAWPHAAEAMGKLGAPAAPVLGRALAGHGEGALREPRPVALRRAAAAALAVLEQDAAGAAAALAAALADPDPAVRRSCETALRNIGVAAIPELLVALRSEHLDARRGAMAAIARIGHRAAPAAAEAVTAALADPDDEVKLAAAWALSLMETAAVGAEPALVRAAELADAPLQGRIALAFFRIGKPEKVAVGSVVVALLDPDRAVRASAAEVLGRLGVRDARAVALLVDGVADPDPSFRREAVTALGKTWKGERDLLRLLLSRLDDGEKAVVGRVRDFVERERSELLPVFVEWIVGDDPELRSMACRCIELLGRKAGAAAPELRKACTHSDPAVSAAAKKALASIESR